MAAYAAVVSLMHIIDDIQHHPCPPISLDKQQVQSLTEKLTFFQEFLESYNSPFEYSKEADPLEIRIADATYVAEDVIESFIVHNIQLGAATTNDHDDDQQMLFYQTVQKVIEEMDLIKKVMEMVQDKYAVEAQLHRNVFAHTGHRSSSTERSNLMVGFDDELRQLMEMLIGGYPNRQVVPIVGMGGIGKTTLTRHVYVRPLVKYHFDVCAWATISQQYNTKEILCELLSQANKKSKEELSKMSENELGLALYQYLFGRRFLIVMDDMWSVDAWDKIQSFFPNNENGSRVLVTTRPQKLSSQLNKNFSLKMKFLNEFSSWNLFSKSVFGEECFPLALEEIGKKIVENCRGLPLSIVVVGGLLRKMEHTKGCWESISNNSSSVVNSANEDFCLKILKMSYNHLPVYLKPCFLYMGVFEEDRAVRVSTLVKLWVSEGFLNPVVGKSLETIAKEYLNELVDRNLILVHELGSTGNIKYCKIHDLLRDLCWREAGKEGFYNVIGKHKFQGLNRQRCVVIPRSTSKEEVHDTLQSMLHARSFVSDYKEILPLPKSRLLRTFKAYDRDRSGSHDYLLDDLFRFVNSRYLVVGVHMESKFPSLVCFLWNLQTLIVFKSEGVFAPNEFWKMAQLRHVEFHKGVLELPKPPSVIMKNLQTLKGVSLSNFYGVGFSNFYDKTPLSMITPNIKKLGVARGELPDLNCFTKLESYRCQVTACLSYSTFPYSLKKLSLGSHTYHCVVHEKLLETIGTLPLLQKLKLERVQFVLKKWETSEDQFPSLKFLELKWCLLESWITESSHFPRIEKLHLYALKELEEIPCEIGEISTLQSIQLEYCSKSVVESAKKITEEQEDLQVRVLLFNSNDNQALRSLASPNFLVEIEKF